MCYSVVLVSLFLHYMCSIEEYYRETSCSTFLFVSYFYLDYTDVAEKRTS